MKCPSEHLLFENQQICYLKSYNSPSSDDFLTPSQLSCLSVPESSVHVYCVRSSVFWSHLHAWGCWLQVIRLAVYRVLPAFKNGTISGIQSHIIMTSPVNLSCRCRFSLLCVGHLRILPGAPPQDAGLGAGVSQPRALHAAFQTPAPSSHRAHGHRQHETSFLAAQLCNKETLSFVFSCR